MNAKIAKRLRREAKEIATQQGLPNVDYDIKVYPKQYMDLTGKAFSYKVYTLSLKDSERKVYKQLKKQYKENY